jgi:hypothetical protein
MANTTWSTTDKSANITLSGLNLVATSTSTAVGGVRAADKQIIGKFYWEYTTTTWGAGNDAIGFATASTVLNTASGAWFVVNTGTIYNQSVSTGIGIGSVTSGSVVCVALDLTNGLFFFRLGAAGNWNGSAANNPATGVGGLPIATGSAIPVYPYASIGTTSGHAVTANFGDSAFTGTVPSGFTSGFTSGASPPVNELVTQVAAEQWGAGTPTLQLTQVAIEQWGSAAFGNPQLAATQLALEQWASVASAPVGGVTQARAMIMA